MMRHAKRRAGDFGEAMCLAILTIFCLGVATTFPDGAQGDGVIQPIFTLLGCISGLLGVEIALGAPFIGWMMRPRS